MIQNQSDPKTQRKPEQLKRFGFFESDKPKQKQEDPRLHPIKLADIQVSEVAMIGPRIILLDREKNRILIYVNNVEGEIKPFDSALLKMTTNQSSQQGLLVTYGEDANGQAKTGYLKIYKLGHIRENYSQIKPKRIIISELGKSERQISCMHFTADATMIALGTKKGHLIILDSKNILEYEPRLSDKMVDGKQIKNLKAVKRLGEIDVYYTTEDSFYWFQNLSEKRRLVQSQAQIIQNTTEESVIVTFKGDNKTIYEYKGGKQIRNIPFDGEKKIIKQFRRDYLVISVFQKRNQNNDTSEKYKVLILDTKNQYIAFQGTYARVQAILTNRNNVFIVGGSNKGERYIYVLTEKDNSSKIQQFFKKSFFSEAYKFAKNQNCNESLLAQISRLDGDLYYSKNQYEPAIKQYILTIGYVEPSYVIRKFLQVTQIDYLIEYLQKIHELKLAKKEHTALLLNCYVKKQKINKLSEFLSEASIQNDLFDIETAIKVCKDLKHFDAAMNLAEKKNRHEFYLKILIQDKEDIEKALNHIKLKVQMQQKQKYIIEFGQYFMKFRPKQTIQLIKLMVKVHSISQMIRGRERDFMLSPEQKKVLEDLNFNLDQLESLSTITFKKPDEYFRLFLVNNEDLQNFLIYLIRNIQKLPHEQIVFHRLIQFYLQMIKSHPERRDEDQRKIINMLDQQNKKYDSNHLLALFKVYDFDEGVVKLCKKLGMRDDLLNFYISKNRDQDILDLCTIHGSQQVDLWMHALKYFVKPEHKKQQNLPKILEQLSKIPNLSPLPILSILGKNKSLPYKYVKQFFLAKLRADRKQIQIDKEIVKKNMANASQRRAQFKKLKTTAKAFNSTTCSQCRNSLTLPSIHFMCGHSFHHNCVGPDKQCTNCSYNFNNCVEMRQKFREGAMNQTKFFQELEEKKSIGFEIVAQFMGKGLFRNKVKE